MKGHGASEVLTIPNYKCIHKDRRNKSSAIDIFFYNSITDRVVFFMAIKRVNTFLLNGG